MWHSPSASTKTLAKIFFHMQLDVLYHQETSENHFKKTSSLWKTNFPENRDLPGSISRNDHDIQIQHGRLPMTNYV
jgi:hypothetical protein